MPRPAASSWFLPLALSAAGVLAGCSGSDDTGPRANPVFFETGQAADLVLGELGFDDAGGSLLFNHPKGIATDGTSLLLADGNNHRVLVWSSLPDTNRPPDAVVGQDDFTGSHSGEGDLDLKWPVDVAAGGGKFAIADTYNHRVLLYDALPTGGPPDLILEGGDHVYEGVSEPGPDRFAWPWGVWTDGERLVVSSTSASSQRGDIHFGGWVLIWNTFPTTADQPADVVLSAGGLMGTPRSITTDGETFLLVGDHNAVDQVAFDGAWYWTSFPTEDEAPPDGFWVEPEALGWPAGDRAESGELVLMGQGLSLFAGPIEDPDQEPDLRLSGYDWGLRGGDGSSVAIAGDRVYVSDYNGNRVVGFDGLPTSDDARPDFVLGAMDLQTDTLRDNGYLSNATLAFSAGQLWAGDALNRQVHCWASPPTDSGQPADTVLELEDEVVDVVAHGGGLVVAFRDRGLRVWSQATCNSQTGGRWLEDRIGTVDAQRLQGIAQDDWWFYALDGEGTLHAWPGVPQDGDAPSFSLALEAREGHLHSDGTHLTVSGSRDVKVFAVATLGPDARAFSLTLPIQSTQTGQTIVVDNRVFSADLTGHRVFAWRSLTAALEGEPPDVLLGATDLDDIDADKTQDGLFWPLHLGFDGTRLYVAEYKFSGRVLRYTGR